MIRYRSILSAVVVLLLGAQTGCASRRVPPPTLGQAARASLGTVAVSWVDTPPEVNVYSTHTAGRGAAQGAGTGAKAGLPLLAVGQVPNIGGAVFGIAGIGVSLAGALIGAPIGALVGATKAPSKAAVTEVARTFAGHTAPLDIGGCIAGRIHQTLHHGTPTWSVLSPVRSTTPPDHAARDRALALREIDTVLDLGPLTLEVSGPFGTHPDGSVILTVPVRLARVADGAELLTHDFRWARGTGQGAWPIDATAFGELIERACTSLAADVVRALVGWVDSPAEASGPDDRRLATLPE